MDPTGTITVDTVITPQAQSSFPRVVPQGPRCPNAQVQEAIEASTGTDDFDDVTAVSQRCLVPVVPASAPPLSPRANLAVTCFPQVEPTRQTENMDFSQLGKLFQITRISEVCPIVPETGAVLYPPSVQTPLVDLLQNQPPPHLLSFYPEAENRSEREGSLVLVSQPQDFYAENAVSEERETVPQRRESLQVGRENVEESLEKEEGTENPPTTRKTHTGTG